MHMIALVSAVIVIHRAIVSTRSFIALNTGGEFLFVLSLSAENKSEVIEELKWAVRAPKDESRKERSLVGFFPIRNASIQGRVAKI